MEPDLWDVPCYRYFMLLARGIPRLIPPGRAQLSITNRSRMERRFFFCIKRNESDSEQIFFREQNSLEGIIVL